MDNTIIQQGRFTADGANVLLPIRSDVDWMMVYNTTIAGAAQVAAVGVKFYWQRGFAADSKWVMYKSNAANAANLDAIVAGSGFTLVDTSVQTPGALQATITAISNAAIPVVSAIGHGLLAGDVVRLINVTGGLQLCPLDFTVGNNTLTNNTFSLDYAPQIVAATVGSFRRIKYNPIFYPRRRIITAITVAQQAVVTLSVTHQFTVGQEVRLRVPAAFGMVEMDNLQGSILAIDVDPDTGNTVTLDIDSSAFTAFAWPLSAAAGHGLTPAEMIPVGENTATALAFGQDILADSTVNRAIIGMQLAGGADCPGGDVDDVMYWVAGKSFSVDN